MRRSIHFFAVISIIASMSAMAQPPGGRGGPGGKDGPPPGGQSGGPGGQRGSGGGQEGQRGGPSNAVLQAVDADGDHTISAEEIKNAAAALKKLDKNRDGNLTSDEIHPERANGQSGGQRGGQGRAGRGGPGGGGPGGGGPGGGGPGHGGPPTIEQFMSHAMTFDANKDGMLSKTELKTMAAAVVEEMSSRSGPGGRPGGGNGSSPQRPEIE